jgi:hypothetical protein
MNIELKEYLSENNIESNIDLPKKEDDDYTIQEIRKDPIIFSDLFLTFFNQFRKDFCDNSKVKTLIEKNKKYAIELVKLKSYKFSSVNFGKADAIRRLINYVNTNFYEMQEFFDLCVEVYLE